MIKSIILLEENAKITFEKPISEESIMSIVAAVMFGSGIPQSCEISLLNLNHVFHNVHNKYKGR